MALYWELAICYGSLMAILLLSVNIGRIRKNNVAVKYIQFMFLAIFLVSAAAILFTLKF